MAEQAGRAVDGGRRRWPLFLLAVLATISLLLHAERSRRRGEIRNVKEQLAAIVSARPVDAAKVQRTFYYKSRFFLAYPVATSFAVADFVRRLTVLFRPREMLGLWIDPGLHGFDFQLAVAIAPGPPVALPWRFAALFEKLRHFPDVAAVAFTEKVPAAARSGKPQVFLITGQAELQ